MTSTFAHPSVSKHEDDIVLANFLTNKLILDQVIIIIYFLLYFKPLPKISLPLGALSSL